jgi:flavin reductase (DIM6/NTAB) family NADH-FMN oxidoreductase RutF
MSGEVGHSELRRQFTAALRRRSDTVHAITYVDAQGAIQGLTATAVVSVLEDPPTMLVCIHREARSNASIRRTGRFTISIFSEQQQALAERLAQPGTEKRLHDREISQNVDGVTGAAASLSCVILAAHEHATHTVFVAEVRAVVLGEPGVQGLQYNDGRFCALPHAS